MSAVQVLRAATAADHETVDAAFGGLDLKDRADYVRFLTAHARALPAVEPVLDAAPGLPPWRARTALIRRDLAEMRADVPPPLPFSIDPTSAATFGAAYVIEGSRLGGGLLSRQVGEGLPSAYLSDTHRPGEWRGFMMALDAAGGEDAGWIDAAVKAAKATFALYKDAARCS